MNRNYLKHASRVVGMSAGVSLVAAIVLSLSGCAPNDPVWQKNQRDLANLEACGYTPKAWDPWYPDDLQAAQKRLDRGECGAR